MQIMRLYHIVINLLLLKLVCADLPQFKFTPDPALIQSTISPWEAGVIERVGGFGITPLELKVNVAGNCPNPEYHLMVRCPEETNMISARQLEKIGSNDKPVICDRTTSSFVLEKSDNSYTIKILSDVYDSPTTKFPFVDLRVRTVCSAGKHETNITSNKLKLFNLNFLKIRNIVDDIVTKEAVEKLINIDSNTNAFVEVQYLNDKAYNLIKDLQLIVKNKLDISILLTKNRACVNFGDKIVIGSVSAIKAERKEHLYNLVKSFYIDLDKNKLHFAPYGMITVLVKYQEFRVCVLSSTHKTGEFWPMFSIIDYKKEMKKINTRYSTEESQCKTVATPALTLIRNSGVMDFTCPIICTHPDKQDFKFNRNRKTLFGSGSTASDWVHYPTENFHIHKSGKILRFPSEVTKDHEGEYECEAGNVKYSVNAKVYIFPEFDDSLPSKIYAMRGESYSVSCKISHFNVGKVNMRAGFIIADDNGQIESETSDVFNKKFSSKLTSVSDTPSNKDDTKELNIRVTNVPTVIPTSNKNFSHILECIAEVEDTNVLKMLGNDGPRKKFSQFSQVYFIERPTMKDFEYSGTGNCSDPKETCSAKDGATFTVTMSQNYSSYLLQIGVDVTAAVMFVRENGNELPIADVMSPDTYKINFTRTNNMVILNLIIQPITTQNILKALNGAKLRPVFDFKYQTEMKSLVNNKSNYSKDSTKNLCVTENNCFYSTSFDKNGDLSDLLFETKFSGDVATTTAPQTSSASINLIIAILIAVILLMVITALLIFLLRRDNGQTYLLDEKERQQGNNPEQEAKDENFKEYQRPESNLLRASQHSLNSDISAGSGDDNELNEYGTDDIDLAKFGEDGSFIGNYTTTDRRRQDVFNASGAD